MGDGGKMNQLYAETIVKRKDTPATIGLRLLMILAMIIGFLVLFLGQPFGFAGIIVLVVMIYLYPRLNVDFEYIFVDGQIDFDKISGKSKRKTMLRIDFDQVEVMAPANSHALDSYTHVQCETRDFSSHDKSAKPYVIIANSDNKKLRIIFEPDEKMLFMIRQKSPRKVSQY
jgi:hypothetical protein